MKLKFMKQRMVLAQLLTEIRSDAVIDTVTSQGEGYVRIETIEFGLGRPDTKQWFLVSRNRVVFQSCPALLG